MDYDRDVLVAVLVAHQRQSSHGCRCGWDFLGASHPEHVIDSYEQVMVGDITDGLCVLDFGHPGPCVRVLRR